MAPQVLRQSLWSVAALVAATALLALALYGERPSPHFGTFEAAGILRHIPLEEIGAVEVASGARRWQFTRDAAGWRAAAASESPAATTAASIENALRLLRNSAPERILSGDELAGSAAFGLDPPALVVAVKGPVSFSVAFGVANPLGLARYARVEGHAEVVLLPRYVADAWEAVVGLRSN